MKTELTESLLKCKVDGNILFLPPISSGPLANYNEVRTALLNAGAKYKKNSFVFPNNAQQYIDRLTGGEKVNIKKEFQFFGTPQKLAARLVKLANISKGHRVLEPEAGQAAIVNEIVKLFPEMWVDVCEIMDINQNILSEHPNVHFICADFLNIPSNHKYDRIVANPPFSKNQDIDHIHKMYECLNENGRMVSMASKHWQFGKGKKEAKFSEWLKSVSAEIIEVEAGEFKESGTSIATVIIVINK